MNIFYLNNFRGFFNTFLVLQDVNFMVGENSTGKTSILSALKIFSEPNFIFNPKFNTDEIELGYFKDIVSKISKNDSTFEIAVLPMHIEMQKDGGLGAYLMQFGEYEGRPKLKEFRYISRNKTIRVFFDSKDIEYSFHEIDIPNLKTDQQRIDFFKSWIANCCQEGDNRKKLKSKFHGLPPLFILRVQIEEEISPSNKKERMFSAGWPVIFAPELTWIAPIRAKPKRIYEQFREKHTPEGEHMPVLMKSILKRKDESLIKSLNLFGKESGLFDEIKIKDLGRDKTSPFEIQIRLNKNTFRISNVGYGVSQILPLIAEILLSDKGSWIAIQQPEVHLHPRAQASFGEFIFEALKTRKINFLIETHSDYTIDRFRLCYKKLYNEKIGKAQVIFFKRRDNQNYLYHIPILPNGKYYDEQPESFRKFFIHEEINLLEI